MTYPNARKEEIIHVYVSPDDLRDWADQMEERMKKVLPGDRIWVQPVFSDDGRLQVHLTANQSWFHERDYWSKRKS